jgi:hypothetical protein
VLLRVCLVARNVVCVGWNINELNQGVACDIFELGSS